MGMMIFNVNIVLLKKSGEDNYNSRIGAFSS